MKSTSSNGVLGIKRSVDMNMNTNIPRDEDKRSSSADSLKSRRSSKSSKIENCEPKINLESAETSLTFTSEDDVSYEPGGEFIMHFQYFYYL
jgi:hypothetical protein